MASLPSETFNTEQALQAFINTYITPNGMKRITGDKENSALNGIFALVLKSINNYPGARIISEGGDVTLTSPFNVITGVPPTSLAWNNILTKEYYVINTTPAEIPLASSFSYFDAFLGNVTAIPANSSIHIVLATNNLWIQFYNPTGDVVISNPIVITQQPVSQTVTQGQTVVFTASADGGVGILTPQWTKDGTDISGANLNTYTIQSAQTSDTGTYGVRYTDGLGVSKTSNQVPLIVNVASLQSVYVGAKVSSGYPDATTILTGILTTQNANNNVLADWTSFAANPRYLFWAIQAVSPAAAKNFYAEINNPINSGPMLGPTDTFNAAITVNVNGNDYYVGVSNIATSVANVFTLSKT